MPLGGIRHATGRPAHAALARASGRGPSKHAVLKKTAGIQAPSSLRTISAPALSALSFPRATSRGSGAIPQLVQG